jgi:hypothetical protein
MKATPAIPACTCREVSVQDVSIPLNEEAIADYLLGKESYRRTDFIVLRADGQLAITRVQRAEPSALFSPIIDVQVLAFPHETAWVEDPEADVMNATQLARAARKGGKRAAVVKGLYEHVNFTLDVTAMPLRVFDVAPPAPSKLWVMVNKVLDYADLPAIDAQDETYDLHGLLPKSEVGAYSGIITPCRVEGFEAGVAARSLDQRPQGVEGDLLFGCARTLEIYRHFYGTEPRWVNFCPRDLAPRDGTPVILKCCQFEFNYELDGLRLTVPWGSTLRQVEAALDALCNAYEGGEQRATSNEQRG